MARRSTRLSSRNSSSTPKRVSLSHDAPTRTPKTAPVKLVTVSENDEMPGAFPRSASPPGRSTPSAAPKQGVKIPVRFDDGTPKQTTPIKPAADEMHPAHHQQSTAKPLEEARWLGFANMAPHTEPATHTSNIATLQDTPTRSSRLQSGITSPQYKFTFEREHSLELSPEAKRLMFEKREEAARIREQMVAAGENGEDLDMAIARKIATPKGRSGRYSQAHLDQFKKMDSIAGHPSAFRANPDWKKPSPAQPEVQHKITTPAAKCLKRSLSKAQLDESDRAPAPSLIRSPSKPSLAAAASSSLPRATSLKNLHAPADTRETSPAKRVKRFQGDDATITRPSSSRSDARQPSTPSPVKQQPSYPDLTSLVSPTQASLVRANSVKLIKTSKIPAPALTRSPSKAKLVEAQIPSEGPSTPFLARSPSKNGHPSHATPTHGHTKPVNPGKMMSPLLVKSPIKDTLFKKHETISEEDAGPAKAPLLSRSPLKKPIAKDVEISDPTNAEMQRTNREPLLARSPMKMSVTRRDTHEPEQEYEKKQATVPPLFSRSPMKISVTKLPDSISGQQTSTAEAPVSQVPTYPVLSTATPASPSPTKSAATGSKSLLDRFSFLRSSPVKSILRSPQRLYSDDPAKVAAGTHLATPPKQTAREMNKKLAAAAKTTPVRKQVDFSSSTKARYERAQSEVGSTPSKETTPASTSAQASQAATKPTIPQFPSLSITTEGETMTPQKRRQTIAPGDFTFRAGPEGIVFSGASPNAPASMAGTKRSSTIRHVSAEPTVPPAMATQLTAGKKRKFDFNENRNEKVARDERGVLVPAPATTMMSKKRKFSLENGAVVEGEPAAGGLVSDKENTPSNSIAAAVGEDNGDERPAKRMKPTAPTPEKRTTMRRPTLGVRPKGEVKGRNASGGGKGVAGSKEKGVSASAGGAGAGAGGAAKDKKSSTTGTTISQARLAALAQPKRRG